MIGVCRTPMWPTRPVFRNWQFAHSELHWIAINVNMISWCCDITWRRVFANMERVNPRLHVGTWHCFVLEKSEIKSLWWGYPPPPPQVWVSGVVVVVVVGGMTSHIPPTTTPEIQVWVSEGGGWWGSKKWEIFSHRFKTESWAQGHNFFDLLH